MFDRSRTFPACAGNATETNSDGELTASPSALIALASSWLIVGNLSVNSKSKISDFT
jgi:hypothetical protein